MGFRFKEIKMVTSKEINVDGLKGHAKKSKKFKEVMQFLAKRERGRRDTTFSRFKRVLVEGGLKGFSYEDLEEFFSALQEAGAGQIINRSDDVHKARFVWEFNLRSVARAALGLPDPEYKSAVDEGEIRKVTPPRRKWRDVPGGTKPYIPETQHSADPPQWSGVRAGPQQSTTRGHEDSSLPWSRCVML